MSSRPFEKKIEEMRKKQEEFKAREKQYKARQAQAERKARTKRLIEIGATVEAILGHSVEKDQLPSLRVPFKLREGVETILGQALAEDDVPKVIAFLKNQEERGGWFSKGIKLRE